MNSPVIGIDFGATYTKVAFRCAFEGGYGGDLERHQSKAFGDFEEALIPSLVIETGRTDRPWLFGRQAAEIRPGRNMRVFHNWKSGLIKADGAEPDPIYLEVAVQFFRWLLGHLEDSNEVPFVLEEAVVRLCVPAFDNNGAILSRMAQAMQQAGWTNELILRTSEPKANTIGYCTQGRNIKLWTGCPDWGDMFTPGAPFIQFTRQHLLGDHRAALAVLDIGSFTSDLAIVYWTAGNTEDYLDEGNQFSFAHGIVDDLDARCLERILDDVGESWDDLEFDEHERLKERLYSHQPYDLSGNRIGGPKVEPLVTAAIDQFCDRLIDLLSPHVESIPINWFLLTGGGSNIPGISGRLTDYFRGLRANGVRPVLLPTNDSGNRLDTALGATSIILEPRIAANGGRGPRPEIAGPPPLPPLENCPCQGGNRDCIRCGGTGILDESQQSRRVARPVSVGREMPQSANCLPKDAEEEGSPPDDLGTTLEFINSSEPEPQIFTVDQTSQHTLEGWMGELVFPGQPKNYNAFKATLCSNDAGRRNAAWYRLLCLGCALGARVSRQAIRNFWNATLDRTEFWEITTSESLNQAKLDQFFENLIHREFRSVYAEGEQAELLRRVFYDFRKLHYLVFFNDFANVVLEVLEDTERGTDPIKFLRSGWLRDGTRWKGVIGQSMTSPLLFLMREWRRMGLIATDRHDHHCFYMNGPAARAAIRKGWLDWNRYGRGDLESILDSSRTIHAQVVESGAWPIMDFDIPLQILGTR